MKAKYKKTLLASVLLCANLPLFSHPIESIDNLCKTPSIVHADDKSSSKVKDIKTEKIPQKDGTIKVITTYIYEDGTKRKSELITGAPKRDNSPEKAKEYTVTIRYLSEDDQVLEKASKIVGKVGEKREVEAKEIANYKAQSSKMDVTFDTNKTLTFWYFKDLPKEEPQKTEVSETKPLEEITKETSTASSSEENKKKEKEQAESSSNIPILPIGAGIGVVALGGIGFLVKRKRNAYWQKMLDEQEKQESEKKEEINHEIDSSKEDSKKSSSENTKNEIQELITQTMQQNKEALEKERELRRQKQEAQQRELEEKTNLALQRTQELEKTLEKERLERIAFEEEKARKKQAELEKRSEQERLEKEELQRKVLEKAQREKEERERLDRERKEQERKEEQKCLEQEQKAKEEQTGLEEGKQKQALLEQERIKKEKQAAIILEKQREQKKKTRKTAQNALQKHYKRTHRYGLEQKKISDAYGEVISRVEQFAAETLPKKSDPFEASFKSSTIIEENLPKEEPLIVESNLETVDVFADEDNNRYTYMDGTPLTMEEIIEFDLPPLNNEGNEEYEEEELELLYDEGTGIYTYEDGTELTEGELKEYGLLD